ncbi:hypothetical protein ABK040_009469 [Willaertia magna]
MNHNSPNTNTNNNNNTTTAAIGVVGYPIYYPHQHQQQHQTSPPTTNTATTTTNHLLPTAYHTTTTNNNNHTSPIMYHYHPNHHHHTTTSPQLQPFNQQIPQNLIHIQNQTNHITNHFYPTTTPSSSTTPLSNNNKNNNNNNNNNKIKKDHYYDKCILSPKSQFSYKGGNASCTYICLSIVDYFLNNYKKLRHYFLIATHPSTTLQQNTLQQNTLQQNNTTTHQLKIFQEYTQQIKKQIITDIEYHLQKGILNDLQIGHRSCDEVYETNNYYKNNLNLNNNMFIGKLKDPLIYKKLLKEMEANSIVNKKVTALIFTKPPETIAILFDPIILFTNNHHITNNNNNDCDNHITNNGSGNNNITNNGSGGNDNSEMINSEKFYRWIVFDSHPRRFEKNLGGGFYLFKDAESVEEHLKQLFGIGSNNNDYSSGGDGDKYDKQSHVMFEATIVSLKEREQQQQQQNGNLMNNKEGLSNSKEGNVKEEEEKDWKMIAMKQEEEMKTLRLLLNEERKKNQELASENTALRNQFESFLM